MAILSKESLLGGSDLVEQEVEIKGGSVRVRSLPAAYSNQAQSEATEVITTEVRGREQRTVRINMVKLEALQVLHGMIDPKLDSIEEAHAFSQKYGSAWQKIVAAIDKISGIDKEAIETANAMFQPGGSGGEWSALEDAVGAGNGRSDLPVLPGA